MVTTELKPDEIFNPIILAQQEVVNSITQYLKVMPSMPSIEFPISTKMSVCNAEIKNKMQIFEKR